MPLRFRLGLFLMLATAALVHAQSSAPCAPRKARLIYPGDGATNVGVITARGNAILFTWSAVRNAASYDLFIGRGSASPVLVDHLVDVEYSVQPLPVGPAVWYLVTNFDPPCPSTTSDRAQFVVAPQCVTPGRTAAAVISTLTTGEQYVVRWKPVLTSTHYELQESLTRDFASTTTIPVDGSQRTMQHDVTGTTPFFYRVRAVAECNAAAGPWSAIVRIVIAPKPPGNHPRPELTIQSGSKRGLTHRLFIEGRGGKSDTFAVTSDKPWVTIVPSTGPLPANGATVVVAADPRQIDNGSHVATLSVAISTSAGASGIHSDGSTVVSVPISINAVTPVNPIARPAPAPSTIVFPSVSHANGVSSQWQSDVRLSNPTLAPQAYQLTFTPSNTDTTTNEVHSTTMEVDPGDTAALNDIITEWYGFGALNDGLNGTLAITAVDGNGNALTLPPRSVVVASSRTYDVTESGTLGQYIPPIPFSQFAPAGAKISLQQIAQSAAFRTNIGLLEGAGVPATATISIFNNSGAPQGTFPIALAAGEHKQLNSFLAANQITLPDGRIEIMVSGGGKVAAYASVVDNSTQDPLLVTGVDPSKMSAKAFTVPGVADLNNGALHWRTDLRLYNPGAAKVDGTLTFFPAGHGTTAKSIPLSLNAGSVTALDDVLNTRYGQTNASGAIQFKPDIEASIVFSGRTYDQELAGTFGQFVPAVTGTDATGVGEAPLQLLQVEQSEAFRTNVGVTEVSGRPVSLEITAVIPDTKVAPVLNVDLGPNEFIQFTSLLKSIGYPTAYNVRLIVKATSGTGRVAAYASVVDNKSNDPTYVPAQ